MIKSSMDTRSHCKTTLYSTLLFEIDNENLNAWATNRPSGDYKTILAAPPTALEKSLISSI